MSEILLFYKRPDPTTWVYMSSFLTIGLFFVFHRFWSIRNLDVVLLILLAPGLLMVHEGRRRQLVEAEVAAQRIQMRKLGEDSGPDDRVGRLRQLGQIWQVIPVLALIQQSDEVQEDEIEGAVGSLNAESDAAGASASAVETGSESDAIVLTDGVSDNGPALAEESIRSGDALPDDPALPGDPDIRDESDFEGEYVEGPYEPRLIQRWGFIYLFVVEALILIRLMLDPLMVRRPLLDPNLTSGGLTFIGISLFIFMMANVVTSNPRVQVEQGPELGPGYALMNMLPAIPTRPVSDQPGGTFPPTISELTPQQLRLTTIAKAMAIVAQLAIVFGIVLVSSRHFSNVRAGVGCAALYLMLPYTAQMTGRVDHALPAALLLWAVLSYRQPFLAGIFFGLAGGLVYYPLFLLPLWSSFYWQRGVRQFAFGVVAMLGLLMLALLLDNPSAMDVHLQRMFGLLNPARDPQEFRGIWALGWNPIWRLPVIVAFVILSTFFAIWPAQKNLASLISGSAALMVAAQFWHGYGGGLYIAWFLPLLLLTIFRPNLQDRIATKVVLGGSPVNRGSAVGREPV